MTPKKADQEMCKLLEMANKETSMITGDFSYHIELRTSGEDRAKNQIFLDFKLIPALCMLWSQTLLSK